MIRTTAVLVRHSFARMRGLVLGLAALLGAFEFLLTQMAAYLFRHSAFASLAALMPDFMRNLAGPFSLAVMSFSGIVAFGYFHPMVVTALLALTIAVATEPAAEAEMRFVDLTLARPVLRADLLARTLLLAAAAIAIVLGAMTAGTWIGVACCIPADAPVPPAALVRSLVFSLAAVAACWTGLSLAVAVSVRRRAVAASIAGGAALTAYLLDYIGRVWAPAERLSRLSPFHYFDPAALVAGEPLNVGHIAVLGAIGIAGVAVAVVVFLGRDV